MFDLILMVVSAGFLVLLPVAILVALAITDDGKDG